MLAPIIVRILSEAAESPSCPNMAATIRMANPAIPSKAVGTLLCFLQPIPSEIAVIGTTAHNKISWNFSAPKKVAPTAGNTPNKTGSVKQWITQIVDVDTASLSSTEVNLRLLINVVVFVGF